MREQKIVCPSRLLIYVLPPTESNTKAMKKTLVYLKTSIVFNWNKKKKDRLSGASTNCEESERENGIIAAVGCCGTLENELIKCAGPFRFSSPEISPAQGRLFAVDFSPAS